MQLLTLAKNNTWLITGAAGFIGSHLVEQLLISEQQVVGLDSFITGSERNLQDVRNSVGEDAWSRFRLIAGDITDLDVCREAVDGVHYVLHHAALGSVPRSIKDPLATHRANVDGFVNMLVAARDEGVERFVYASSSSVYGDHPRLPKVEDQIGSPLSPYALSKAINEQYATIFAKTYGFKTIGLRYFNVFGRRQDPAGPYAAVIPKWISLLLQGEPCVINGDGLTSRDFCHVSNVVRANLLAATTEDERALDQVYNIAVGGQTTLSELYSLLCEFLASSYPELEHLLHSEPMYGPFRPGDVRHSLADISKARFLLGYCPVSDVRAGLEEALSWYVGLARQNVSAAYA